MSEQEKKAIERMIVVRDKNVHTFVNELTIVLNLIEKQQKEISKLKKRNKQLEDTNKNLYEIGKEIGKQHKYTSENYISKSKVEEKIEELKQERTLKYDNYMGYKIESREQQDIDKKVQVLQELLESEDK